MSSRNRYATMPRYRVTLTFGKASRQYVVRAHDKHEAEHAARDKHLLRTKQSPPSDTKYEAERLRS